MGGIPGFIAETAAESNKIIAPYKKRKTMVCIFQRGAMDGLMAVTPFTDQYLQAARPGLFMSAAKGNGASLIDLDGRFGLHPSMQAFEPMFREKRLGIVHGIGSPNSTRSHFDAQDYMELGTPFNNGTSSGWLNRAVGLLGHDRISPFSAVSLTSAMPRSFYGDNPVLTVNNLQDFAIQTHGNRTGANMAVKNFEDFDDQALSGLLKQTRKERSDVMKMLQKTDVKDYRPANNAIYPNSPLGSSLKQIAQLIKMEVGLEVAFAESNGWDTHFNQGTENGSFARNAADLSNSMMAFWNDVEPYQDDVSVMTMTEFGRTVYQNGTGGTDHGRASCNFILGNAVAGGLVHGNVKPLAIENLEDGSDLAVTTDFRSVFSEVAGKHLKIKNDHLLFPDFNGDRIGVMRG